MMAAIWSDIADDVAAAKRQFSQAIAIYKGPMVRTADTITTRAFQHAMRP